MNRQELIQKFKEKISSFIPILKTNNNPDHIREPLFYSHGKKDTIIKVLTLSEREIFEAPIKFLLNQKQVSEKYSDEYVQDQVVSLYHNVLIEEANFDQYIQDVIYTLFDKDKCKYFVYSEIENIVIHDDSYYPLADSGIKILKKEDLPYDENYCFPSTTGDLGTPVIFTEIEAGDTKKAEQMALHNFTISFNLLRLYAPNFRPALKGCLMSGTQRLVIYNKSEKILSPNLSKVGNLLLTHAYLNTEIYQQLKNAGIEELQKSTPIAKLVKDCLYWFGLGLDEKYPSARLLDFVTVLEATLKRKDENVELSKAVSERGALLLYDRFEERKEARKQLKEIYATRGRVVHTGVLIDDKDLASLSGGYARTILIKLIQLSSKFNGNFDDVITYLDDLKLKYENTTGTLVK